MRIPSARARPATPPPPLPPAPRDECLERQQHIRQDGRHGGGDHRKPHKRVVQRAHEALRVHSGNLRCMPIFVGKPSKLIHRVLDAAAAQAIFPASERDLSALSRRQREREAEREIHGIRVVVAAAFAIASALRRDRRTA